MIGAASVPDRDLAGLEEGESLFEDYMEAVHWAQDFARANREVMMDSVLLFRVSTVIIVGIASIGAYIMGAGFLLTAFYLFKSLKSGRKAPANPWGGNTLEWACSSPPPYYNFHKTPVVTEGPYDYENWTYDKTIGGYVRTDAKA